jgi:periplasmic protein TonB
MNFSRFVIFSSLAHLALFGSHEILGGFYSKPQVAIEAASSSVDVAIIEEIKKELPKEDNAPLKEEAPKTAAPQEKIQTGALPQAQPNYLRNPAPVYPLLARRKGWEGVVILKVFVNSLGTVTDIYVEQSSGHSVLDESAVKTVRKWKFRPARIGSISMESLVRVPVRFVLESS